MSALGLLRAPRVARLLARLHRATIAERRLAAELKFARAVQGVLVTRLRAAGLAPRSIARATCSIFGGVDDDAIRRTQRRLLKREMREASRREKRRNAAPGTLL